VCGSGTIAIEAALIAAHAAPGLGRRFAAEDWPTFPSSAWKTERDSAADARARGLSVSITASDRDLAMIEAAHANAAAAGVAELVAFRGAPAQTVSLAGEQGCVVCNPPYGERLGSAPEACDVARALGSLQRRFPSWSFFALSALPEFPRCFGARPSRTRKLYNGNLRCWLYQYFGPLP
jgi:putative N6-adenine-specific DNA methylase